jgi:outer membrane protein assembly factor BamB
VFAIDRNSGESVWKSVVEGRINSTAALAGDRLYFGDLDGRIYAMNAKNGQVEATFETEGPVYGSLIATDSCVLALWAENTLACLDLSLESIRWSRTTASAWSSFQPLIWNDLVLVGDEEGMLHAFRLEDGSPRWTHKLEGEIKGLGASEETLFVGTLGGTIYAFRPDTELTKTAD